VKYFLSFSEKLEHKKPQPFTKYPINPAGFLIIPSLTPKHPDFHPGSV
jgi:hypothetical protein